MEPQICFQKNEFVPFSKAPTWVLEKAAIGRIILDGSDNGKGDIDFRKRYAAILLQERSNG